MKVLRGTCTSQSSPTHCNKSQACVLHPVCEHHSLNPDFQGITESFDELTSQFNLFSSSSTNSKRPSAQPQQEQTDTAQIRLWLVAISHVVSRLERTHAPLVEAIVNMPWMTLDSATVKAYTIFIGMLLSARPEYLSLVLAKIAQGFTHRMSLPHLTSVQC